MSKSKVELVNMAFEILRISGLTTKASPEELTIGLDQLESMMSEFESRNICSSYNFEEIPSLTSDSNLELKYQNAVQYNLASRLATFFGKEPTQGMMRTAVASLATWSASCGRVNQINYPNRMPRGSGNTFRKSNIRRFYRQETPAPDNCETNYIKVGETNDFQYDFASYLGNSEIISSYEIVATNGIQLISSTLQSKKILMTVKGITAGNNNVVVTITTSDSRVNPQKIYFQVEDV